MFHEESLRLFLSLTNMVVRFMIVIDASERIQKERKENYMNDTQREKLKGNTLVDHWLLGR